MNIRSIWAAPLITLTLLSLLICSGCYSADVSGFTSMDGTFKITVYSGGEAVREFKSVGKVLEEQHSDGYYFEDASTKKFVRVSGTVVIEQL